MDNIIDSEPFIEEFPDEDDTIFTEYEIDNEDEIFLDLTDEPVTGEPDEEPVRIDPPRPPRGRANMGKKRSRKHLLREDTDNDEEEEE